MKKINLRECSAYLITDLYYRKLFSGLDIDEGLLLICKRPAYFVDARYFFAVKEDIISANLVPVLYKSKEEVKDYIIRQGITSIFIDYDKTTLTEYETYKTFGVEILDGTDDLKKARSIKDKVELKNIETACDIAVSVVEKAFSKLKVGVSEIEISKFINAEYLKMGASGESFSTIVAFGSNSAIPHHKTSERKLKNNEPVLIDTGAVYNGYCSDITRTAFFGEPDELFIKRYNAVKKANELAIENIKENIDLSAGDEIARDYLKAQGYGENFTHSLGHGLGLEIHEHPSVSPKAKGKFAFGTAFTIEPGVYFDGEYGIRIEDTVYLDGTVKRLTKDSNELKIIK